MDTIVDLHEQFRKLFGDASAAYRVPGRVNLIGEHTDYNDGFVLPACIGFSCWVAIGKRDDDKLIIHSENFNETIEACIDKTQLRPSRHWSDYPLGVAWALQHAGYRLRGANIYIRGNIPVGAGLGSSAALEVSTGCAILAQLEQKIDRVQLALLCQQGRERVRGRPMWHHGSIRLLPWEGRERAFARLSVARASVRAGPRYSTVGNVVTRCMVKARSWRW